MIRSALRWILAAFYAAAGYFHLAAPDPFLKITPDWVPAPATVVALTGVAELLGAAGLVQWRSKRLRRYAGMGLALYALCVWPANFNHFLIDLARPDGGLGLAYHLPRLAFQPVLIWLAMWAGEATDWPFARHGASAK
ncbi:hypothetical protein A6F68_01648 [Tsuneonella dongtanensis]|uniref:DoxX n=1 Tax=Tsuneonella dongtanensis TaxID=692370 RepID=A0A1B2ADI6_9SPHN|nr:DoxX family protein [Tsuneonella dongtanensis]ANY20161.1 hypothetical protein A6F68_01648 [Tsuneonella dongtanensis]